MIANEILNKGFDVFSSCFTTHRKVHKKGIKKKSWIERLIHFFYFLPSFLPFSFLFIERKEKHVEVERLKITVDGTPLFSELSLLRLIIVFTTWIQKNLLPLFSPDSRFNRLTGIEFLSKDKIYRPTLGIHPPSFLSFLEPIEG